MGGTNDKKICKESVKAISCAATIRVLYIECNMLTEPQNQGQIIPENSVTGVISAPDWRHKQSLDPTIKRVKELVLSAKKVSKAENKKESQTVQSLLRKFRSTSHYRECAV